MMEGIAFTSWWTVLFGATCFSLGFMLGAAVKRNA